MLREELCVEGYEMQRNVRREQENDVVGAEAKGEKRKKSNGAVVLV